MIKQSTFFLSLPRGLYILFFIVISLVLADACSGRNEKKQGKTLNRFEGMRMKMVEYQIEGRGIKDHRILEAMRSVPRHKFVPPDLQAQAYNDEPLPIGSGQTISQPYIVAYMTEQLDLNPDANVLEIGTGSGYQAAILAELVDTVYTIEIISELSRKAQKTLRELGYHNIEFKIGDGFNGWPEAAPFDAIIVTAAPEEIPQPLVDQLKIGGKMIIPVGDFFQDLFLVKNTEKGLEKVKKLPVRFVPLKREEKKKR